MIEMEAGRELDAAVAGRVMGWRKVKLGYLFGNDDSWGGYNPQTPDKGIQDLPHYSTDIAAAWEVAERVKGEWYCEIRVEHSGCPGELWDCLILSDAIGGLVTRASGETAPLAICRAALGAVDRVQGV